MTKEKCTSKFCQMDDFGGCSCKEWKIYTKRRHKIVMNDFREEQATRNVIIGVCLAAGIILTYLTIQYVYG